MPEMEDRIRVLENQLAYLYGRLEVITRRLEAAEKLAAEINQKTDRVEELATALADKHGWPANR